MYWLVLYMLKESNASAAASHDATLEASTASRMTPSQRQAAQRKETRHIDRVARRAAKASELKTNAEVRYSHFFIFESRP